MVSVRETASSYCTLPLSPTSVAATRILSRLSKTSACLPPPPLIAVQNPLQAVPLTCYLSASELEQHLKEDLRFVQSQARYILTEHSVYTVCTVVCTMGIQ